MRYRLSTARDKKTGTVKDIETKYSGQLGYIGNVTLGDRLVFDFININNRLITSEIEAYNSEWKSMNRLVIQTKNSVYVFEKESR